MGFWLDFLLIRSKSTGSLDAEVHGITCVRRGEYVEDLVARIIIATEKINKTPKVYEKVRRFFIRRYELCNDFRGRHCEYVL